MVLENQGRQQIYLPQASEQQGSWGFVQVHPSNGARHPERMTLSNVCCWALLTGWDLMMSGYRLRKTCSENKGRRLDGFLGRVRNAEPQIIDCTVQRACSQSFQSSSLLAGAKLYSLRNQTQHAASQGGRSVGHNYTGETTAQVRKQESARSHPSTVATPRPQ